MRHAASLFLFFSMLVILSSCVPAVPSLPTSIVTSSTASAPATTGPALGNTLTPPATPLAPTATLASTVSLPQTATFTPTKPPSPRATSTPVVGSLNGHVTREVVLGRPQGVAGVRVALLNQPEIATVTNNDGYYVLPNLPNGLHFVWARGSFGRSDLISINVNGNSLVLEIELPPGIPSIGPGCTFPSPSIIRGHVVAEDRRPVSGAIVWDLDTSSRTVSEPDGSFQLVTYDIGPKTTILAATANRWGFTQNGGPQWQIVLKLHPPIPQPPTQVYDFIQHAPEAQWRNNNPIMSNISVWNLRDDDLRGSVLWRYNVELEDGRKPARVLETRLNSNSRGAIRGTFPEVLTPQSEDRFIGCVGFLKGATTGSVLFTVLFIPEGRSSISIFSAVHNYGKLLPIVARFPQAVIDRRGRIQLMVEARGLTSQDWAAWTEAQFVPGK